MPANKTKITVTTEKPQAASKPAAPKPASAAKPVMDIMHPGTGKPADATTRPIIVTNRPVLQDPMVSGASDTPNVVPSAEPVSAPSPSSSKLVVQPLTAAPADTDADGVIEPGEMKPAESEVKADPSPDEPAPDRSSDKTEPTDEADEDADGTPTTAAADAELAASAKAMEEIDNMVEEKTYFLPINSVEKRRSKHVFIFGMLLIVLLAVLWLDVALDAGFIKLGGLSPLTHFFNTIL